MINYAFTLTFARRWINFSPNVIYWYCRGCCCCCYLIAYTSFYCCRLLVLIRMSYNSLKLTHLHFLVGSRARDWVETKWYDWWMHTNVSVLVCMRVRCSARCTQSVWREFGSCAEEHGLRLDFSVLYIFSRLIPKLCCLLMNAGVGFLIDALRSKYTYYICVCYMKKQNNKISRKACFFYLFLFSLSNTLQFFITKISEPKFKIKYFTQLRCILYLNTCYMNSK